MTDRYATAHAARCSRWPNPHEGGGVPWDRPTAEPEPWTVQWGPLFGWYAVRPDTTQWNFWFSNESAARDYAARLNLEDRNPPKAEPKLEPAEPKLEPAEPKLEPAEPEPEPAKPWTVQRALVFGWYAIRPDTTQWNLWFPSEAAARDYTACLNLKDRNPPTAEPEPEPAFLFNVGDMVRWNYPPCGSPPVAESGYGRVLARQTDDEDESNFYSIDGGGRIKCVPERFIASRPVRQDAAPSF